MKRTPLSRRPLLRLRLSRALPLCSLLGLSLAGHAAPQQGQAPRPAVFDERAGCGLEPPGSPAWPALPRRERTAPRGALPALVRRGEVASAQTLQAPWGQVGQGALAGKTVYLSPGHGFTVTQFGWRTQRGNTNGIVEDLVSAEAVHQFLLRYLLKAGARVVSVREQDLTERMVIVDDADADAYFEAGPAGRFFAAPQAGFGRYGDKLLDQVAPFGLGKSRLLSASAGRADASARYVPAVPERGEYNVYVSYAQGPNRAADAHYVVHHPGGDTHFRVDQRRHGGTWVLLGRFFFERGQSAERGAVEVLSDSATPGAVVSLDAARFGGGMGDADRGMGKSGRPRWEESARSFTQWNGAPPEVYDNPALTDRDDDVGARSRYAAWDHEDGEDAVYVAWHTNAPDPGVGTSSYVYGPNPPDGNYDFQGVPGSDKLMGLIHDEIVSDIRAGWSPGWPNRGKLSAYFGEVNPRHNPETPATLIEVAFHSTAADALQLRQAGFRKLVARAMYQGIAKFFAQKDNTPVRLLPEPPTRLCARGQVGGAAGTAVVTLQPASLVPAGLAGDAPTGYRVYRSRDGLSWDEGQELSVNAGGAATLRGLPQGEPIYLRVTAVNAGGESLAAPLAALRLRRDGQAAKVLLISGFDRADGGMLVKQDLSAWDLGTVQRMLMDRMNDTSYLTAHARALAQSDVSFDSCDHSAVPLLARDSTRLNEYAVVDWQAGEQSVDPPALSPAEQREVTAFLAGGGRLILSGSEALYALVEKGDAASKAFVDALGVSYVKDSSGALTALAVPGGLFDGVPAARFDDSKGGYLVDYPDVLVPALGSQGQVALRYQPLMEGMEGPGAAVINDAKSPTVAVLGFPLESVYDEGVRAELLRRLLTAMNVQRDGEPPAPGVDGGVSVDLSSDAPLPPEPGGCQQGRGGPHAPVAPLVLLALAGVVLWRRPRRYGPKQ